MSIQEKIRYGASELKAAYNRNLGLALGISVGFHVALIGLYMFGINIGKADDDAKKLGINKTKLINIAPPPEPPTAAPPPPPPMIPPELMSGSGDGGGVAARAGNPIPVPDAIIAPDIKEFATTNEISVATPEGGTGGGFGPSDGGEGLGAVDVGTAVDVTKTEAEPDPDAFVPDATDPTVDYAALQSKVKYPEIARKNGIEGQVVVRVLIDKTGKPMKYRIDHSDNKLLDNAAVDAVMSMQFTPGVQNTVPVQLWVSVPIKFELE